MSLKKIVIHEDVVKRYGYTLDEVLACLLINQESNVTEVIRNLINKGKVFYKNDEEEGKVCLYNMVDTNKEILSILLDSKKELPNVKELEDFYYELAKLFPKGIRPGTASTYWKGNKRDTIHKLQMFIDEYGQYTTEQIYEATKHYVESFHNDYTYMRTLPYFIGKFGESTLANVLENMDEEGEGINQTDGHGEMI